MSDNRLPAERLREILRLTPIRLETMPAALAGASPGPGPWTRKEILGHLIDLAAHHYLAWVGARLGGPGPGGFDAEAWVRAQGYASADWSSLAALWTFYNDHILRLWAAAPPGGAEADLSREYLGRLEGHLSRILAEP